MDHFELFTMAYSWGGFESLILCNQPEEIAKIRPGIERKLTGSLIRLHIGLKTRIELIADLKRALTESNKKEGCLCNSPYLLNL